MSWFGAFKDYGGFWLGFVVVILIWIRALVFVSPMFLILALYLDFEGAKNIHVLEVLIWGSKDAGGSWLGQSKIFLVRNPIFVEWAFWSL